MPAGQPRNIGIICCMHPDEEKSREAYEYFKEAAERGNLGRRIEVVIGNELAYEEGLRYSRGGVNLNTVFPGNPNSPIYEVRRAAELFEWAQQFDIVLDVHGGPPGGYEAMWLHSAANLTLRGLAAYLDVREIVTAGRGSVITSVLQHAAIIELVPNSTIQPWLIWKLAQELSQGWQHVPDYRRPYTWYEFLGDIPRDTVSTVEPGLIPPFTPLPPHIIEQLGLHPEARALGWRGDKGYYDAEIVRPIQDPWHSRIEQHRVRTRQVI